MTAPAHPDPRVLIDLAATGTPTGSRTGTQTERALVAHLTTCDECAAELRQWRVLAGAGAPQGVTGSDTENAEDPDAATLARCWSAVTRGIHEPARREAARQGKSPAASRPGPGGPRAPRRLPRRRVAVLAVAATVALAVGGVLLPRSFGGGAEPAAARTLEQLAAVAAAAGGQPLPDDALWYQDLLLRRVEPTMSHQRGHPDQLLEGTYLTVQQLRLETWLGPRLPGNGEQQQTVATPVVLPADQSRWSRDGRPELLSPATFGRSSGAMATWQLLLRGTLGPDPTYRQQEQALATLPTGADDMGEWLRETADRSERSYLCPHGDPRRLTADCPRDVELFRTVTALLVAPPTAPAQRAALFRAAAELDDVRLLGSERDARGRSGTGLAIDYDGKRYEVVVDPATSRVLEERTVLLQPEALDNPDNVTRGLAPGTALETWTFVTTRVVRAGR